MILKNLGMLVHETLREYLQKGDTAIDATVGNGFDTLFLAECVGDNGIVHGFDIQEEAIHKAKKLLAEKGLVNRVHLYAVGHQYMLSTLPETLLGKVAAVMFNLGYLPQGDHSIITQRDSTIRAIGASLKFLRKNGVISIVAYKGHSGGYEEFIAVKNFLEELDPKMYVLSSTPTSERGPEWFLLKAKP